MESKVTWQLLHRDSVAIGVLIVLYRDREDDAILASDLVRRARSVTPKPVHLILADPDFEQWLYSSIETLGIGDHHYDPKKRGLNALKSALDPVKHVKPVWQPKLTSRLDLTLALSRSPELRALQQGFRELRDSL